MRYCQSCVIPDTRPHISIGPDGVCNACRSVEYKRRIDWITREKTFKALVEETRALKREYDCLIPVSGGKDSTWQVVTCLEYGLRPLAVTWKNPARTVIGQRNLDNLVRLGVDHIDFQVNPKVEKKFLYQALVRYGATAIPMHMALFNIPLKIAVKYNIPLVIWGENSALEYGGTEDEWKGSRLDAGWLKKYGVTHGTTAADWVSQELTREELTPYFGPTPQELDCSGLKAVFLGFYFSWDPETSLKAALTNGFRERSEGPKTGIYDYADIDDDFISIHHYLKWYKFGMTRAFDNVSLEIRQNRMTRENAISMIKTRGEEAPREDIKKFCAYIGITQEHFYEVIERFRNREIWAKSSGRWVIPDFLIADWRWS